MVAAVVVEAAGLLEHAGQLHAARAHVIYVGLRALMPVLEAALLLRLASEDLAVAVRVERASRSIALGYAGTSWLRDPACYKFAVVVRSGELGHLGVEFDDGLFALMVDKLKLRSSCEPPAPNPPLMFGGRLVDSSSVRKKSQMADGFGINSPCPRSLSHCFGERGFRG